MKKLHFGFIELGEKVVVSDPCYEIGTWCQGIVENVKKGLYGCTAFIQDDGVFGKRVFCIKAELDGIEIPDRNYELFEEAEIGVDSGQAGIYDYNYFVENQTDDEYSNEHSWYRIVCDLTNEKLVGTLGDKCFVSESGYGDGSYDCYVAKNEDGEIVGIQIEF